MPTPAIWDARPSALDFRVLLCVSLHDGMSLLKEKGAGCYASNRTLAAEVGCDYTSLSRSISRLIAWGYVEKERQSDDRRMTTLRVRFPEPDSWPERQPMEPIEAPETPEIVGRDEQTNAGLVGREIDENGSNPPWAETHYIPLKGELDSVETGELNSSEEARLTPRSLGRKKWIADNDGAKLAIFERAWKAKQLDDGQLVEFGEWLKLLVDDPNPDDPTCQRAQRLYYDLDAYLWDHGLGEYQGQHDTGEAA